MRKNALTNRQGDVALVPVTKLPSGCKVVPLDAGRVVLAYGEVTGHAHAIDLRRDIRLDGARAEEIADAAIARAKARQWESPTGDRFLEVVEPVALSHEEHSTHVLAPGLYEIPIQCEQTTENMPRIVAD